jgi:NADH dehydrogenase FAD-containing subunit
MYDFKFVLGSFYHLDRREKIIYVNSVLDDKKSEILPRRILPYDILVIEIMGLW